MGGSTALGDSYDSQLAAVTSILKSWDGDDVTDLVTAVRLLDRCLEEAKRLGIDELDLEAVWALGDLGTRDDADWPAPWTDEACPFAWAVDRKGQYLGRELGEFGAYSVRTWEDGLNQLQSQNPRPWRTLAGSTPAGLAGSGTSATGKLRHEADMVLR